MKTLSQADMGAAVEYVRSSPVPLPAALPLLLAGFVPLARRQRHGQRAPRFHGAA